MFDILVISISNPILVGIYKNGVLYKEIKQEGKTSDVLSQIFEDFLKNYEINRIFYVNSPGSYMSIKVAYIYLKTISIVKKIPLFACNGFYFNKNSPIKALGKKYFIKKDAEIICDFIAKDTILHNFELSKTLDEDIFSEETLPIYNLPAV